MFTPLGAASRIVSNSARIRRSRVTIPPSSVTGSVGRVRLGAAAGQAGEDVLQQLHVDRLLEHARRAGGQRVHRHAHGRVAADDHDLRRLVTGAQARDQRHAVGVRKHELEQHDVRPPHARQDFSRARLAGDADVVAPAFEQRAERSALPGSSSAISDRSGRSTDMASLTFPAGGAEGRACAKRSRGAMGPPLIGCGISRTTKARGRGYESWNQFRRSA